ncbi:MULTISPECIES: hypothetical protein [unclassified Streptomyces]|uniref:hypothetical protein n=1 Tax=unclassified Streptomyces TaxID=2593676 RepID=UPI002E3539F6|nr:MULTISPECIES: hypothetical protein [unclassified Streptomyces]WUC64737.1 hypothetical protein OG861_11080 [Streptomyces sp. NBC_00539]
MASLAWLLIPLFAAIGAAIWGSWAARDRTTGDISELTGYARFREAMDQVEQTRPATIRTTTSGTEKREKAHSGSDAV